MENNSCKPAQVDFPCKGVVAKRTDIGAQWGENGLVEFSIEGKLIISGDVGLELIERVGLLFEQYMN